MKEKEYRQTASFHAQGRDDTQRIKRVSSSEAGTSAKPSAGAAVGKKSPAGREIYQSGFIPKPPVYTHKKAEEPVSDTTMLAFLPRKQARFALFRAIGNMLYALGYAGEYRITQIWRVLRDAGIFFIQLMAFLLGSLSKGIGRIIRGIGHDIAAPFVRNKRRRRALHRLRERAKKRAEEQGSRRASGYIGARLATTVQFFAHAFGVLLPVAALAALGITVYSLLSMQYALAVEVNGEVLGYVEDQQVVENAKTLLRGRMRLAQGQEMTDWQLNPTYTLSRTSKFTTTQQLANAILLNTAKNPDDVVQATGLYINGELYAVTNRGEDLRAYLDGLLEEYRATVADGAQVNFKDEVVCDPTSDEVFMVSSVQNYEELILDIDRNVQDELVVTADGATTLQGLARQYGLDLAVLRSRNDFMAGMAEDEVLPAGTSVVVRRAKPFLQIQAIVQACYEEEIPYSEEQVEDEKMVEGLSYVSQQGVPGIQRVWYSEYFEDGELVRRDRIAGSEEVLVEPVTQIVQVGVRPSGVEIKEGLQGTYIWPVPSSTWGSRGMSTYHRGLDINGSTGDPIYAANSGTVVNSGWHYSYGYYIVIDHGNGVRTLYGHNSSLLVTEGQVVSQGELIAGMGSTGNSTGTHLHFEVQVNGALADPLEYVWPTQPGYVLGGRQLT